MAAIRERIRYEGGLEADSIGCTLLVQPTFFPRDAWIPQPSDWKSRTQSSATYDLSAGEGRRVWEACLATARDLDTDFGSAVAEPGQRYGAPTLVTPRLGQGTFRISVTDAYDRACAISGEHSLPALEASHIMPFAVGGPHTTANGLLLRADFHRLFDLGYVTVDAQSKLLVSGRLRDEFQNGRTYYPFDGQSLRLPRSRHDHPDRDLLRWHNEHVFAG